MVDKYKLVITLAIVVLFLITLRTVILNYMNNPEARLRREIDYLKSEGVPIEQLYFDVNIGCLVVEFNDMEEDYVQPVREIVGYDQPILFRELNTPKMLFGEPPAKSLEICRAYNTLEESLDLRFIKEIDLERGLLQLVFMDDLTDQEIKAVTKLVGDEVPIEFLEWRWKDRIFMGEPLFEVQELESALKGLQESESEVLKKSISGSCVVDERRGMLKIYLYRLEQYSGVIKAIRETIGRDTPALIFLLPYTAHEPKLFYSASDLIEDYIDTLNLTDIGYEILHQTDEKAVVAINFLINGEQIKFQELELERYNDTWQWASLSRYATRSPSSKVEVVGYLVKIGELGNQDCLCSVEPVVENAGEGTAYIYEVKIEIKNSTQILYQTYRTLGRGLRDGIIKAGHTGNVYQVNPFPHWMMEDQKFETLLLDNMRGKRYEITLILKDGEGTVLDSKTFTHTFSQAIN